MKLSVERKIAPHLHQVPPRSKPWWNKVDLWMYHWGPMEVFDVNMRCSKLEATFQNGEVRWFSFVFHCFPHTYVHIQIHIHIHTHTAYIYICMHIESGHSPILIIQGFHPLEEASNLEDLG